NIFTYCQMRKDSVILKNHTYITLGWIYIINFLIIKVKVSPSIVLNPAIILNKVVFPHPDGPKRVKSSPFLTSKLKFGITTTSPYLFSALRILIFTLNIIPPYILYFGFFV